MKIKICKPDDVIITEGEVGDTFYIILTGKVIVYKSQKVRYAINQSITKVSTQRSSLTVSNRDDSLTSILETRSERWR